MGYSKIIGYIKQYLPLLLIAVLVFIAIYLKYILTIDSFHIVKSNQEKIKELSIKHFQEIFENKLDYDDFKQLYKDISFLLQSKNIFKIQNSISQQFTEARENKKFTKQMENFENGSYFVILEKLRKKMPHIKIYYFHPLNTTEDLYFKFNVEARDIYILDKKEFNEVNSYDFITIQASGNLIKINQKEILNQLGPSLSELLHISKVFEEDYVVNLNNSFGELIKFSVVMFFIILISVISTIYIHYKIYVEKIEKKEEKLIDDEDKLMNKEMRLDQIEHVMQHDIKTNIDQRLTYLSMLHDNLKNKTEDSELILFMYTLDLTIKLSNDYLREDSLTLSHFYSHLKNENLFKFANKELETYGEIGRKILDDIIIFKMNKNSDEINDFPVKDIYQNEFSSLIFRLINNALKHSSDKKVLVDITRDSNNYLCIIIKNKVTNLERTLYEIQTSLESKDEVKNITIAFKSISKFGMQLIYEEDEENSSLITRVGKRN